MTDQPDLTANDGFTPEEPPPAKIAAHLSFGPGNSRIPEEVQAEWRRVYRVAFDEALENRAGDHDPMTASQIARRMANGEVLRVHDPQTYEEALALPDWQVLSRRVHTQVERVYRKGVGNEEVVTRELRVITIGCKKFRFPVPEEQAPAK